MTKYNTKVLQAWQNMISRCKPDSPDSKYYYERGIKVCREWLESFEAFRDHIGDPPTSDHTVDRIDNDGCYEPGNVRWATSFQQNRNRTINRFLTIDGVTKTVAEWAEVSPVTEACIFYRLNNGFNDKDAVFTHAFCRTKVNRLKLTIDGIEKPIADWANFSPVSKQAIFERIDRGLSHKEAVFSPPKRGGENIRIVTFKGQTKSLLQWAVDLDVSYKSLNTRLKTMSVEEAFSIPKRKTGKPILITVGEQTLSLSAWAKRLKFSRKKLTQLLEEAVSPESLIENLLLDLHQR